MKKGIFLLFTSILVLSIFSCSSVQQTLTTFIEGEPVTLEKIELWGELQKDFQMRKKYLEEVSKVDISKLNENELDQVLQKVDQVKFCSPYKLEDGSTYYFCSHQCPSIYDSKTGRLKEIAKILNLHSDPECAYKTIQRKYDGILLEIIDKYKFLQCKKDTGYESSCKQRGKLTEKAKSVKVPKEIIEKLRKFKEKYDAYQKKADEIYAKMAVAVVEYFKDKDPFKADSYLSKFFRFKYCGHDERTETVKKAYRKNDEYLANYKIKKVFKEKGTYFSDEKNVILISDKPFRGGQKKWKPKYRIYKDAKKIYFVALLKEPLTNVCTNKVDQIYFNLDDVYNVIPKELKKTKGKCKGKKLKRIKILHGEIELSKFKPKKSKNFTRNLPINLIHRYYNNMKKITVEEHGKYVVKIVPDWYKESIGNNTVTLDFE